MIRPETVGRDAQRPASRRGRFAVPAYMILLTSWLILTGAEVAAQSAERAQLSVLFADSVADVTSATSAEQAAAFATAVDRINFIVAYSLPDTRAEFLRLLENQRIGKQVGAA